MPSAQVPDHRAVSIASSRGNVSRIVRDRRTAIAILSLAVVVALSAAGVGERPRTASAATATESAQPVFRGSISRIGPRLRRRMTGVSWHRGCPVGFGGLRLVRITHWDFAREPRNGRLVIRAGRARGVLRVFRELFERRFAIRRVRLVDAYGGSDHRSMRADNTSAFNCREVSGRPGVWSEHAYGRALDLNPVENPWVEPSGRVSPPAGRPFARRKPHRKGMVARRGAVVRAFAAQGWKWGGAWAGTKDYQHFSTSGR